MRSKIATIICAIAILWASRPALGQVTYDGCTDFRGLPVASVPMSGIGDIAIARIAQNGAPIILYNPQILPWVSPATRLFFYAHECAHHVLGHTAQPSSMLHEQEADCWAIRTLVQDGLVDEEGIAQIQGDIARFGRGDWTHIAGPKRAINLTLCLQ